MLPALPLLRLAAAFALLMQAVIAQASEPLRLVYFQDYAPLSSGETGKVHGALIDVMNEALGKRMKIPLEHAGFPWARAQRMVQTGEADAFVTVHNPERQAYTDASSEIVYHSEIRFYVSKQHPELKQMQAASTLAQFRKYRFGSYIGAGWSRNSLKDYQVTYFPAAETMYRAAGRQLVDIAPEIAAQARPFVQQLALDDELVELPQVFDQLDYRLCIRKNSPFAERLPEFDRTLRAMRADGTLAAIFARYKLQSAQ